MRLRITVLVGILSALFLTDAMACSDTLYRVGKGISYRVYTAPLPGSVLVYGQSEGAQQLAQALAESGHGVRFVDNQAELTSELASRRYDVVIAPYSDHETIEESAGASGADETTYLPVALSREEAEVASQSYSKVMVADRDDIKHYLKAIHKTLKAKT